jgi:hypothetical protein
MLASIASGLCVPQDVRTACSRQRQPHGRDHSQRFRALPSGSIVRLVLISSLQLLIECRSAGCRMFLSRTVAAEVCMEARVNDQAYAALKKLDKMGELLFDFP